MYFGPRRVTIVVCLLVTCCLVGCSRKSQPTAKDESLPPFVPQPKAKKYEPPQIPLARRRQVFLETEKLIDRYEEAYRKLNEDVADGKITPEQRVERLAELRKKFDEDLEALMGRYGLRAKDYPAIRAEGLEKGWANQ